MKKYNILALILTILIVFAFVYGLARGNTDKTPQENKSLAPLSASSPTPSPQEMTFDELDSMMKERYGKGIFTDPTPSPAVRKINLDEKSTCWVEKDGSFVMTARECQEIHDKDPFEFQVKAYQNCLAGKNPELGDSGTPESRKEKCSNLTGITEKQ